jgi:hypothetical protein
LLIAPASTPLDTVDEIGQLIAMRAFGPDLTSIQKQDEEERNLHLRKERHLDGSDTDALPETAHAPVGIDDRQTSRRTVLNSLGSSLALSLLPLSLLEGLYSHWSNQPRPTTYTHSLHTPRFPVSHAPYHNLYPPRSRHWPGPLLGLQPERSPTTFWGSPTKKATSSLNRSSPRG